MSRSFSGFEVYDTKNNPKTDTSKDSSDNFVALNGDITEIAYYDNLYKNSYDEDYEGISNSGSASFEEINLNRFYKGKKICLKKGKEKNNQIKWSDLDSVLLGFISEISLNTDGVDVKLVGMSKLLEQEKEFSFKKTKRSKILKKIIEAAGLKADIDVTGLKDDKTDYTNVSSSSSGGDYRGDVPDSVAEASDTICQGLTDELEKAKAIWKYCHDNLTYEGYSNTRYGAKKCLKVKKGNCVDHAHLVVAMLRAQNIKAAYKHSSSCYEGRGHVWATAKCNGKWYDIDASVKSCGFNQVGQGCTGSKKEDIDF